MIRFRGLDSAVSPPGRSTAEGNNIGRFLDAACLVTRLRLADVRVIEGDALVSAEVMKLGIPPDKLSNIMIRMSPPVKVLLFRKTVPKKMGSTPKSGALVRYPAANRMVPLLLASSVAAGLTALEPMRVESVLTSGGSDVGGRDETQPVGIRHKEAETLACDGHAKGAKWCYVETFCDLISAHGMIEEPDDKLMLEACDVFSLKEGGRNERKAQRRSDFVACLSDNIGQDR